MSARRYDRDYFEGRTRQSPPHSKELIYPWAARTSRFLCHRVPASRALDLGCAKGYLVEAQTAAGIPHSFGLDVSPYAVTNADHSLRGRLLVGDAQAGLPFRDGALDLVTALDLFEHLVDPLPLLLDIRRILASHGRAYLKICHPNHPNATRDPTHVNVQPLAYWKGKFRQAGFRFRRCYETELSGDTTLIERAKNLFRLVREWAALGTPADYKFLLRKTS
ncbi:MAG: class I SAM-dependent methyltransferase [Nitrospiraceae bacterium]